MSNNEPIEEVTVEIVDGEVVNRPPIKRLDTAPQNAVPAPRPEELFRPKPKRVGRKKIWQSEEELQNRINEYFASCMAEIYNEQTLRFEYVWTIPPTMGGLARALGVSVSTLRNYRHSEEYGATVQRARSIITEFLETGMLTPGNNPRGFEFQLKNANQGYSDTTHIAVDTTNRLEQAKTDEEIRALIAEIPD